jgi:hypothetical protein
MYAVGFVYAHYLDSLDQALAIYDSLSVRFPESPYSKRVLPQLKAVELAAKTAAEDSAAALAAQTGDSLGTMPDSTRIALGDSSQAAAAEALAMVPGQQAGDVPQIGPDSETPSAAAVSRETTIRIRLDLMARRRREMRRLQMNRG